MRPTRRTWLKGALALGMIAIAAVVVPPMLMPKPTITLTGQVRLELVNTLSKKLADHYVFPEVGVKMGELIRAKHASGAYEQFTDADLLAKAVTADLYSVSRDLHLRVKASVKPVRPSMGMPRPDGPREQAPLLMRFTRAVGSIFLPAGVDEVKLLAPDIGYLKMTAFFEPEEIDSELASAFTKLKDTSSLIIDLRDNNGGDPQGVALLASYFFDKPTHLNDIYVREGNKTIAYWTQGTVAGPRYAAGKKVYILTSRKTPSAGEEFAYDMKHLQRATIVGEPTWGGAHPARGHYAGQHFIGSIPFGRAINPVTRSNWEGTGVLPDIAVPPEKALEFVLGKIKAERLAASTLTPISIAAR